MNSCFVTVSHKVLIVNVGMSKNFMGVKEVQTQGSMNI
jgi:hypothetical protein